MATTFLKETDIHLLAEGNDYHVYEKLGAHLTEQHGTAGRHFAVWAPNARQVAVVGDFNDWQPAVNPMQPRGAFGLWECFIPGIRPDALYRYSLTPQDQNSPIQKLDPCAFAAGLRPQPASRVCDLSGYAWGDAEWLARRDRVNSLDAPITIYEVHLGSWMRVPEEGNRRLTYRELAPKLAEYAHQMGYTHVGLLPVSEYLSEGGLGYETVGYFAPTSRHGTPHDFLFLIDTLHRAGIGVILDWTPARFSGDELGLANFDGTRLYERAALGAPEQADGTPARFDYGRREVSNFLISSALFWLDKYHVDGVRVAGVGSMLYLDVPGKEGAWVPNEHGGREDLGAIAFLRRFNEVVHAEHPDVLTLAEEATGWQMVTRPAYLGGLGFGLKWDVGWAHDTLQYLEHDPIHRKFHHNLLTFRMLYAFSENFVLPLPHDEVVRGQWSLLSKLPGDDWQKFANLRLLYGYTCTQPGKKLLFMGGEFGQWQGWDPDTSIDWHLLQQPAHRGLQRWVRDLNTIYRSEPALHQLDCDPTGFEWIDCNDSEQSVLSFLRRGKGPHDAVVVIGNFTPIPRYNYRVGVSQAGHWEELLNSDAPLYGGSGQGNMGGANTAPLSWHGRAYLLNLTLPPLGMIVLKKKG